VPSTPTLNPVTFSYQKKLLTTQGKYAGVPLIYELSKPPISTLEVPEVKSILKAKIFDEIAPAVTNSSTNRGPLTLTKYLLIPSMPLIEELRPVCD